MDRVDIAASGFDGLIGREWLVANGLGGYASSSLCGLNTRKYHGLLVAAMSAPVRRMVLLSRLDETLVTDSACIELSSTEYPDTIHPEGYKHLRAFSPEPFPRWAYQANGFTLEKSVRLLPGQNTVCVSYTLLAGDKSVELELRPQLALRGIHELMYQWNGLSAAQETEAGHLRIAATNRTPEVFIAHDGNWRSQPVWYLNTIYRREQERGYAGLEDLWTPGVIHRTLAPGQTLHVVCSTEPIELDHVLAQVGMLPEAVVAPRGMEGPELADLVRSARSYVVRGKSAAIMTHYPWSTPSLRGWMIAMSGLLLVPGRFEEARSLLEYAASLAEAGVIPTELSEDAGKPVFQGADVSLWFINAVHAYLAYTADDAAARGFLPVMEGIIEHYSHGTSLGISTDADGLIRSHVPAMPTSWMDAKVGDWVITPRQGRPVELNALWYNALRIVGELAGRLGHGARAAELAEQARGVREAFNRRFWNAGAQCLYDVVDDWGPDPSVRPNQLFAMSLPYPVLEPIRWAGVLNVVMSELLTPVGVRTLSPRDPAYQGKYEGNVVNRDRAYHQGSAYPWLLGPLVTALLKSRGRNEVTLQLARSILVGPIHYLRGDGMGMVRELFDGDAPHRPGGALGCAPATGELVRCWAEEILALPPARRMGGFPGVMPGVSLGAEVSER